MKRYVLSILLMTMFACPAVFSQEPGQELEMEREMQMHNMRLEMEEHGAELDFRQKMRELELAERGAELERARTAHGQPGHPKHWKKGGKHPLLLLCLVVHILVAIWVYRDIRERNSGSGIWIVLALLTGLLGVLVYAIVRLGDTGQKKT